MKTALTSILALCLLLSACLEGAVGPVMDGDPEIRLHVTGGFAGVDYTILVDGPQREVVGESCVNGCDFEDGQILHGLTGGQVASLAGSFLDAGIHDLNGTDFGNQCCDQFNYDLSYMDRTGTSNVRGTSEGIPQDLRDAIGVVAGFASGVYPIVVDQSTDRGVWPSDPFVMDEIAIQGDHLSLRASHGGGCAAHHFDLVAFGGWMESNPVQTRVFLSHDGNGDMCEAWLQRRLTFDLTPLKKAYQKSYGVGDPGTTTLIISLDGSGSPSSMAWIPLEYVF